MKRHLLAEFGAMPWALLPAYLGTMNAVLSNWQDGVRPSAEVLEMIARDQNARAARKESAQQVQGSIAVLPLYGAIMQRANMVSDVSGGGATSTQQFTRALREAVTNPAVESIIIDIDSPGGSVNGTPELASEIYRARGKKPIIGIANALCASAAYWIGSQCSEIYCTPSGQVGSIGVYQCHQDIGEALKKDGVSVTMISAGKFKVEGNPYEPLSDAARANLQKMVNDSYEMFVADIARGRGVSIASVKNGMGEGRCLSASDALQARMIDGIATFDEVVAKCGGGGGKKAGAGMNVKVLGHTVNMANLQSQLELLALK